MFDSAARIRPPVSQYARSDAAQPVASSREKPAVSAAVDGREADHGGCISRCSISDLRNAGSSRRASNAPACELDHLPFGVVLLDREGTVLFYSATEARLSGYGDGPLGKNLFAIAECVGIADFRQRIMRAMENGPVDLEFAWSAEYTDPQRDLRIRVQSARSGGVWLFFDRD